MIDTSDLELKKDHTDADYEPIRDPVTASDPLADPPRLQTLLLLEECCDPERTERREAVSYNADTECDVCNGQIGAFRGGVIVERVGGTQGQPDVPGEESKAVGMLPVYDFFHPERAVNCPGVPPMAGP